MQYDDSNRGKVQYNKRFHQNVLFDGIKYGNITPTDIDGAFEIHDRLFVLFEIKTGDAEVPRGQLVALQRMIDAFRMAGKIAVLFVARHERGDIQKDVYASDCIVDGFYFGGKWYKDNTGRTLKEAVDCFVKKYARM